MEWIAKRTKNSSENVMRHSDDSLMHYGILGMKWGIRRYQKEDGSRTKLGKEHRAELEGKTEFSTKQKKQNYKDWINFMNKFYSLSDNPGNDRYESDKKKFNRLKDSNDYLKAIANTKEYKDYLVYEADSDKDYAKWKGNPELREQAFDGYIKEMMEYSGKDREYVEKHYVPDKDEVSYEWYCDHMRSYTYADDARRYDKVTNALGKKAIDLSKEYFGESVTYPKVNGVYNATPTILPSIAHKDYIYNHYTPSKYVGG